MPIPRDTDNKKYLDKEDFPTSTGRIVALARGWWPQATTATLLISHEKWARIIGDKADIVCEVVVLEYKP
jgi:hypothetical protein